MLEQQGKVLSHLYMTMEHSSFSVSCVDDFYDCIDLNNSSESSFIFSMLTNLCNVSTGSCCNKVFSSHSMSHYRKH